MALVQVVSHLRSCHLCEGELISRQEGPLVTPMAFEEFVSGSHSIEKGLRYAQTESHVQHTLAKEYRATLESFSWEVRA